MCESLDVVKGQLFCYSNGVLNDSRCFHGCFYEGSVRATFVTIKFFSDENGTNCYDVLDLRR